MRYSSELQDDYKDPAYEMVRNSFNELLTSKNLAFLFGSGCSSYLVNGEERGISTMGPLAQGLLGYEYEDEASQRGLTSEVKRTLLEELGIDLSDSEYTSNLERLMEVLFGFQFVLAKTANPALIKTKAHLEQAIRTIKSYVFEKCLSGQAADASEVMHLYQLFYRKLSQRSRSLPRPTVVTTNYDLFNEIAMDRTGVPYINGFLGTVERKFNPASFRYTLAQKLDLTSQSWTSLDNLIYLIKLHGSLNWHTVKGDLFSVAERPLSEARGGDAMLIYPTPAKQNASFAAPYSDMFREFQTRVVQDQSVLIAIGYGFGDEHVNNIIYQALTIPSFRLVIFAKPESDIEIANEHVKRLQDLNDPRIWIIGTEKSGDWKAHYFKSFVEDVMPSGEMDPAEAAVEQIVQEYFSHNKADNIE